MAGNVLIYLGVVVTPTLLFAAVSEVPRVAAAIRARRARAPAPTHLPVERIAEDLRRVRRTLVTFEPGTPLVRRRATTAAYDALLDQACRSVGVAHHLDDFGEGFERDIERLRTEQALREAGLALG